MDFYRDPIQLFDKLHAQYGDIVRMEGWSYCAHLLVQPEHIKYVLQDNAKNYAISRIFDEITPVIGNGLTTNNGPTWLRQRRMVQTAFNHKHIPAYAEATASIVDEGLRLWESHIHSGKPLDIDAEILPINLRILGKLLFGVDMQYDDPFLEALGTARQISLDHARSVIKFPFSRRFEKALQILDEYTYRQIAERRNGRLGTDILSTLVEAVDKETGQGMSDTELHDEIIALFYAAYEDVANILAWAWYLLAQNPRVETRLRTEVQEALGDRLCTAADLKNMPYLSMTINEVMRLFPVNWSMLRESINEDEIGGFHIPAKSILIFDCFITHQLPAYWDNPQRFDPERFSLERSAGRPRFTYFPFGGGPRQCIGNEVALIEMKMLLARMLQLYRFTLVSKAPIKMTGASSLQPHGGMWMKIQKA